MQEKNDTSNITHVCIAGTVYSLLLYILSQDYEQIRHTHFFFGDGIKAEIRNRFPNHTYYSTNPLSGWAMMRRRFQKLWLRLFAWRRFPFLRSAAIYAEDHLYFSSLLIRNRNYVLLEDGIYWFSIHMRPDSVFYQKMTAKQHTLLGRMQTMVFGKIATHQMGTTVQCQQILLSQPYDSPWFTHKDIRVVDMQEAWKQAGSEKQHYLMQKFDVTPEDVATLQSKTIILFTQPLSADHIITEEEHYEIYKQVISNYDADKLVIKTHPRDNFNYRHYFPTVSVFAKPTPMELLSMMGIRFSTAVTICSTVVYTLPYEVKIDWIGSRIHPKIFEFFGDDTKLKQQ